MSEAAPQSRDSRIETTEHILRVRELLYTVRNKLKERGFVHDQSKLQSPEREGFDEVIGTLRGLTYGSVEYRAQLERLKPTLEHHYAHNSHHPEHYPNGVDGMTLLDLVEMFCDWKAATERHTEGSLERSIKFNQGRFQLTDQLTSILENTRKEMGW